MQRAVDKRKETLARKKERQQAEKTGSEPQSGVEQIQPAPTAAAPAAPTTPGALANNAQVNTQANAQGNTLIGVPTIATPPYLGGGGNNLVMPFASYMPGPHGLNHHTQHEYHHNHNPHNGA